MKYIIKTFGCQMNYADSEKINMIMIQSGFLKTIVENDAEIHIYNTCSVRKKGEDRVYSMIHKTKKDAIKDGKKIYTGVTGCMVRKTGIAKKYNENSQERKAAKNIEYLQNGEEIINSDDKIFGKNNNIDFVFRIEEVAYLTKILSVILKKNIGNDEKYNDYLKIKQVQENKGSANIIIQTGCDNFCTYCIVPHTRGREKSRPKEDIINEIKKVALKGTKEITLIGQNVNSYGKEENKNWNKNNSTWESKKINTPFRKLLEEINKINGIERIRFTSSNPHDMTQDILDSHFDLEKSCNYLHFALQSGSDEILKKMNRKHSYKDFYNQVKYLRSKDEMFGISTDIIVGFPTESESDFKKTIKAMEEIIFDFAYIARYSPRKGTYSGDKLKDDVSPSEKARRWHILNDVLHKNITERSKLMIGTTQEILIQGLNKNNAYGRTKNFKEVYFENKGFEIGDLVNVKIIKLNKWVLNGEII